MNHYHVLGIGQNERPGLIRPAFRDLSSRYRMDGATRPGPRRYRETVSAYEVLCDSARRSAYDAELEGPVLRRLAGVVSLVGGFEEAGISREEVLGRIEQDFRHGAEKSGRSILLQLSIRVWPAARRLLLRVPVFVPCASCHGARSVAGRSCGACDGSALLRDEELVGVDVRDREPVQVPLDGLGIHAIRLLLRPMS